MLRHQHRNQIQNMTSLVGLFGRRMPSGMGRDAFVDLRARFEALGFVAHDEFADDEDGPVDVNLPELAARLIELLDPGRAHRVSIAGGPVRTTVKRAEVMSQIMGELVIALYRRGLPAEAGGAGAVTVTSGDDGMVTLRAACAGSWRAAADETSDLGWTLAGSFAGGMGGTLGRDAEGVEARLPILAPRH